MKILAFLAAAAVLPAFGFSATIYVPDHHPRIQEAINAAADGDTVIVRPGTYVGRIDFAGKAITVESEMGPDVTVIDGNKAGCVVTFMRGEGPGAVLDGFTVMNGQRISSQYSGGGILCENNSSPVIRNNIITANDIGGNGGGIHCDLSSPTITGNTISGNSAMDDGGGISCYEASPVITGNMISGNSSGEDGGGIGCNYSSPTITNNTITGNSAVKYGGGISCLYSTPVIEGNTVSENTGEDGGGVFCYYSSPVIADNIISGNPADGDGGGVYCNNSDPTIENNILTDNSGDSTGGAIFCYSSFPAISDNTIRGNKSKWGCSGITLWDSSPRITGNIITGNTGEICGGISCDESSPTIADTIISGNKARNYHGGGILCEDDSFPTIVNCKITLNKAGNKGGGIYCTDASPTILNCTITGNTADNKGGGVLCRDNSSPVITNTIIWNNIAPTGPDIEVESGSPVITYCDVKGGWAGTGNIDADPLFAYFAGDDIHLTFGSPCKDAGDDTVLPPALVRDFEGDRRINGTSVDMGADEFHTHLYSLGAVVPGDKITICVIGSPAEPVLIAQGSGIQDPPLQTSWGPCYLILPTVFQTMLGAIPADGSLRKTVDVPLSWQAGEEYPFQALVGPFVPGSELTNLLVLSVVEP